MEGRGEVREWEEGSTCSSNCDICSVKHPELCISAVKEVVEKASARQPTPFYHMNPP